MNADNSYTPSKWTGISGFHRAVSEDPKQYQSDKTKNDLKSIAVALPLSTPVFVQQHMAHNKAVDEYVNKNPGFFDKPLDEIKNIDKDIRGKVARRYGPILALSLVANSMLANKFLKNKYLENKGVSKKPFGNYSFNEEAQKKYLKKEGCMVNLEQIKETSYKDELEKIAIRNQVAEYGIRGGEVGTAAGSTGAAGLAFALLKKMKVKAHRTPIVAAATIAGALAGSRVGGNLGAWYGGGLKGTQNLYQQ